jgi:Ser/Thr protein kinase RdoA (MazF antagonist)
MFSAPMSPAVQDGPVSFKPELLGGNMGGVERRGNTVHRAVGPWTPAVHALLTHLHGRLPAVPRVLGFDAHGREVLSYLPGTVVDTDHEELTDAQLGNLVDWTRRFHIAVDDFDHPGPWRYFEMPNSTLIGHNDIAPYNACFNGDELTGVFDWDLAGPSNPLAELAFVA